MSQGSILRLSNQTAGFFVWIFIAGVCHGQTPVTATLSRTFASTPEIPTGCTLTPAPNWQLAGGTATLSTTLGGSGCKGVGGSIQITAVVSSTTISGTRSGGYFHPSTPLQLDVTETTGPNTGDAFYETISAGGDPAQDVCPSVQIPYTQPPANTTLHWTCQVVAMSTSNADDSIGAHVVAQFYGSINAFANFDFGFVFTEGAGNAPDSVSLSNVTPPAGSMLTPGSSQTFSGSVAYTLNTASTGTVALQLSSPSGVIATSPAQSVTKGTSTLSLTLPNASIPNSGNLSLAAVLTTTAGMTTSSATSYTIGCAPGSTSPACVSSITLDLAKPGASQPLYALAPKLPPFCGTGSYSYTGPNQPQVELELLDGTGQTVGHSVRNGSLQSGKDLLWGLGCVDATQPANLIYITEQEMGNFPVPPDASADQVLGNYTLQASLFDGTTGAKLATSTPITYKVIAGLSAANMALAVRDQYKTRNIPVPATTTIRATLNKALTGDSTIGFSTGAMLDGRTDQVPDQLILSFDLTVYGASGTVDAETVVLDANGKDLTAAATVAPVAVNPGTQHVELLITGRLKPLAGSITIKPRFTASYGQKFDFDSIVFLVDSIGVISSSPDPAKCDLASNPQDCLVQGDNTIHVQLGITPQQPGQVYNDLASVHDARDQLAYATPPSRIQLPSLAPGSLNTVPIDVTIPGNLLEGGGIAKEFLFFSEFGQVTSTSLVWTGLTSASAQLTASAAKQGFTIVDGALNGVLSSANRKVNSAKKGVQLVSALFEVDQALHPHPQFRALARPEGAAATPAAPAPPYLAINATWQFDPPIPQDGSFSGTISLNYKLADFPDDPNMVESKLQVISIDSAGAFHVYPTTLDMTNKIASASLTNLDPYYALAVIGPFTQTPAMLSSAGTGYALVNTGNQDSSVNLTTYSDTGTSNPAAITVKSGSQTHGNGPGWVQAWSNPSNVTGASWLDNGSQFAVTPAQVPGQAFVFTDVEYGPGVSTEIDLANTTLLSTDVTIVLSSADGTVQGAYTEGIDAKATLSARVESMFPHLAAGFTGYAVVTSSQTIAASGYRYTGSAAAGLTALPVNDANLANRQWFAPHLGETGTLTTLHLVNIGASQANVTLKAWGAAGTAAAANVNLKLAAGQQYTQPVYSIFGIDPSVAGSIEVESDAPGIFGDVLVADGSFNPGYAFSLPLTTRGATASVLPYATPTTTVLVFNPNSSAATVTVTPFGPDGTAGDGPSVSVPPFGLGTLGVASTGYIAIGSSQPVIAGARMVVASGTTAGYMALPAAGAPLRPPGPAPQITPGGITNAAAAKTTLSRGELATIYGTNFTAGNTSFQAQTLPFPYSLGGVSVTIGGVPAPVYYVNSDQINLQVPAGVPAGSAASVVVTANGTATAASPVAMADYAVGVFSYFRTSTAYDPIIVHSATNTLITPSSPAVPGETLVVYATGGGKFDHTPLDGQPAAVDPLSRTSDNPTITINGSNVVVLFSGLTPYAVGLLQLDLTLPSALPSGNLPLSIQYPGDTTLTVNLAVQGNTGGSPKLSLSTSSLGFGSVTVGQGKDLQVNVSNTGTAALSVSSAKVTGTGFSLTTPSSFTVAAGGSQSMTVHFAPAAIGPAGGSLTFTTNDSTQPSPSISLSGSGAAAATVTLSDSFNRANATACSLGQADLALGGSGSHYYLPIFPGSGGPTGASIVSGALQNNGLDFGGVQLTASSGGCANLSIRGETLPQDLNISVQLLVPKTGSNVTTAGPYFRSRAAAAGDGILGGSSAGYWVQLVSTGEVRVEGMNPINTFASSPAPASFDSTVMHTLAIAAQGNNLQVSLDGKLLSFTVGGSSVTTVPLAAGNGTNNGTVGIAFGSAPDNRGLAGGQRAANLVITSYSALGQ